MVDLVLIVIFSAVLVPLVEFTSGAGRIILGLIFILFSPGYSLIAALFPSKGSLGTVERLALSIGISIAIVPLIGLALNYTPLGIRLYPVLLSVLAFILIMVIIAWYRRSRLLPEERFQLNLRQNTESLRRSWLSQGKLDRILNIVLVVAITGTLITLAYVVANPKVGEKFTEFYILGAEGKADDYPQTVILGESAWVTVGLINREQESTTYEIEITIEGQTASALGPVSLEHDETHETRADFTPSETGENQKVEFNLYKNGSSEVYLSLHIWIDVPGSG
ncbi:MAG: DUF1616 domain-containing protein [Dehalococcoidaceae bacterium]|nr:DUF1616 domain-containing protein [Dehalococcoidaceae bacterium]